jgi:YbbR domain-containing protein
MIIRKRLKKHSLKFISAFLSIFLWIYVLNSEKVKFEKTVTLEYILPDELVFAQKPPQDATFLIEGPRAFVRTVAEREDKLVIDLNRPNYRRQLNFSVDINPAQLSLPFGMVVERSVPRRLQIRLEKKASRIIPVKARFTGSLPDKISLHKTEIHPSEVEVYGPRSLIADLHELPTKPIDLSNLLGNEIIPVEIQLPDERLTLTSGYDLKFTYQVKTATANLTLSNIPIKFLSRSKKFSSPTQFATVKLMVPEKILKNRSNVSSTIQVWADVPEDAKGNLHVPLKVVLPPSMHLLEIFPQTILVNVK